MKYRAEYRRSGTSVSGRRAGSLLLFLLTGILLVGSASPTFAQQAGVDEVAPAIISSGGEIQQGEFGEMFSTMGEPIVGDSTALDSDGGEVTWTGFWNLIPNDSLSGVEEAWTPDGIGATGITTMAPNPFTETLTLYVRLASPALVKLIAYDVTGREVLRLVDGYRQGGTTRLHWTPDDLDGGVYLLQLDVDGTLHPGVTVTYTP